MAKFLYSLLLLAIGATFGATIAPRAWVSTLPPVPADPQTRHPESRPPAEQPSSEFGGNATRLAEGGTEANLHGSRIDAPDLLRTRLHAELVAAVDSRASAIAESDLRAFLALTDPDARRQLASLLAYVRAPPADLFQILLADQGPGVEFLALRSLAEHATELPEAAAVLEDYVTRDDAELAAAALHGLAKLPVGVTHVMASLGDPRQQVRGAAIQALPTLDEEGTSLAWGLLTTGEFAMEHLNTLAGVVVDEGIDWRNLAAIPKAEILVAIVEVWIEKGTGSKNFGSVEFQLALDAVAELDPPWMEVVTAGVLDRIPEDTVREVLETRLFSETWPLASRVQCLRALLLSGRGVTALERLLAETTFTFEWLAFLGVGVEVARESERSEIVKALRQSVVRPPSSLAMGVLASALSELDER